MPPALRKRPFRTACAPAASASASQLPGLDPARASRRPRPLIGSGR